MNLCTFTNASIYYCFSKLNGFFIIQDVSEFMIKLIDYLEGAYKHNSATRQSDNVRNPIAEMFYGQYAVEGMNAGKLLIYYAFRIFLQFLFFIRIWIDRYPSNIQELISRYHMTLFVWVIPSQRISNLLYSLSLNLWDDLLLKIFLFVLCFRFFLCSFM